MKPQIHSLQLDLQHCKLNMSKIELISTPSHTPFTIFPHHGKYHSFFPVSPINVRRVIFGVFLLHSTSNLSENSNNSAFKIQSEFTYFLSSSFQHYFLVLNLHQHLPRLLKQVPNYISYLCNHLFLSLFSPLTVAKIIHFKR